MTLNEMWIRYFDAVGNAVAFSAIGYVCVWLLRDKVVGHRILIGVTTFFALVRATASIAVAIDIYYHGRSTTTWMFTLSFFAALILAFWVVQQKWHLKTTLKRTECAHVLEVEHQLDADTAELCQRAVNQGSLDHSKKLLRMQTGILSREG